MAIYEPDFIESVFSTQNNPTQRQKFCLCKKSPNGYYIVVEAVGGRKNPNVVPVMILQFKEKKWNNMIRAGKTFGELLYENDKEKLDSIDVEFNKKNQVTAAQFASKEAIANTPRSPRLDGIITRPSHKSQEDGSKVTAEQKDLSNSYKQQERDSVGNTEKVGEAVNKPTKLNLKEAKAQARELQRKDQKNLRKMTLFPYLGMSKTDCYLMICIFPCELIHRKSLLISQKNLDMH